MSHTVKYNAEEGLVEMELWGNVTMAEAELVVGEILREINENRCYLVFSDYSQARIDLSVFELYDVAKAISERAADLGISAAVIKRAILVKKDAKNLDFFETATFNRGQSMKLFGDAAEAKKWLFEK